MPVAPSIIVRVESVVVQACTYPSLMLCFIPVCFVFFLCCWPSWCAVVAVRTLGRPRGACAIAKPEDRPGYAEPYGQNVCLLDIPPPFACQITLPPRMSCPLNHLFNQCKINLTRLTRPLTDNRFLVNVLRKLRFKM